MKDNESNLHRLGDIDVGNTCRVASIELVGLLRRRILDIGLIPGTLVKCVRRSPAGDPVAYSIRGALIALRKGDANSIMVHLN